MTRRPKYPTFPGALVGMDSAQVHGHPHDVPVTITVATLSGQRVRLATTADKLPHPLECPDWLRVADRGWSYYWRDYGEVETNEGRATKPTLIWLRPPPFRPGNRCWNCDHVVQAGDLGVWGTFECPDNDDDDESCPLRCWHDATPATGYPFTEVRSI